MVPRPVFVACGRTLQPVYNHFAARPMPVGAITPPAFRGEVTGPS